jgi:hypothetical protein
MVAVWSREENNQTGDCLDSLDGVRVEYATMVGLVKRICNDMAKNNLLKDFITMLDERGYVITNETDVTQEVSDDYSFAASIYKNREVLVPFLCKLAVGVMNNEPTICYRIPYTGKLKIVQQYIKGIVLQFLENLKKQELVLDWTLKDDIRFEVVVTEDEKKRRFFRSKWAELVFRYVIMKTVSTFCNTHQISYKVSYNIELKRKDETELFTELDLVIQIQKRFYIFEVKSGPKINIIQWARRENMFMDQDGLVRNIVCTIYDNIPAEIFQPQLLLNLGSIETELLKILENDFPEEISADSAHGADTKQA